MSDVGPRVNISQGIGGVGSGSGGQPPDLQKYVTGAQKDELIKEQYQQICKLKKEVDGLISERDLLLCEVSNLRFELEMAELKRIQDERYVILFILFSFI